MALLIWGLVLISLHGARCAECTCLLPQVYNVGVMKFNQNPQESTVYSLWCDDVMLCGRAPLSVQVTTVETASSESANVIKQNPSINLWLLPNASLSTSAEEFLDKKGVPVLNYTRSTLPETEAAWCTLVVKNSFRDPETPLGDEDDEFNLPVKYVLSVILSDKVDNVVVVYGNSTEMAVARLSDGLSLSGVMHVLHNTDHVLSGARHSSSSYLGLTNRSLDFSDYATVVVWCSSDCSRVFLNEIIVKNPDDDIGLRHMTRILLVDVTLMQSSGNRSENVSFVDKVSMTHELQDILHLVHNFFHVAVLWKGQDCVRLQTLMKTGEGERYLADVGFGDNLGNIHITSDVFPNTKWRLNGQKFIVGTAIWEPFVMSTRIEGELQYSGLCIDMLEALALSLNFTYEIKQPDDGQYGSLVNGSWTGLVRMLKDKKAQLVVAPIAVNEVRATVVDFSASFYQDYTGVLFKRPDPALQKWKTYFRPFSWQVLMLIAFAFVGATAFGHIVGVKSAELIFHRREPDMGVMDAVQYFFGSLLAQGGVWNPTTGSARMFVSAWWLFCVILAAIYSGNLTASFAVTDNDPSFATLREMLDQDTYDFSTVPGTIWFDIFKFSNRSELKLVEKSMLQFSLEHANEKINETSYHVQRTENGDYGFVSNMGSLKPIVEKNCDLMILKETFLPLLYAVALQKGSPLTDAVSDWILQMNEGGLDLLWSSNWWRTDEGKCGEGTQIELRELTLMDCQSAFFVLLLGVVLALLAVVGEGVVHCVSAVRSRRDHHQQQYSSSSGGSSGSGSSGSGSSSNSNGPAVLKANGWSSRRRQSAAADAGGGGEGGEEGGGGGGGGVWFADVWLSSWLMKTKDHSDQNHHHHHHNNHHNSDDNSSSCVRANELDEGFTEISFNGLQSSFARDTDSHCNGETVSSEHGQ